MAAPEQCKNYFMFPEQPDLVPVEDGIYNLRRAYVYKDNDFKITIAKDFRSDGASVPRIVWTISGITPDGLHRAAALIHDFLYIHAGQLPEGCCTKKTWSRKEADQAFLKIMRAAGVSAYRSRMAYMAVRSFGWTGWKSSAAS